jgi:hypothetical protein
MWMKLKLSCFSIVILLLFADWARTPGFSLILAFPAKSDLISLDLFGNMYSLKGNTVVKYNLSGEKSAEYTKTNVASFTSLDVSDPLKILLFSKFPPEIFRTDNNLTPQGNPLDLTGFGLPSPTLACNSFENGCWIYDEQLHELIRINNQGIIDQRSGNLEITDDAVPSVSGIFEKDFTLYVVMPTFGLWQFDRYGSLSGKIPLGPLDDAKMFNDKIIYRKSDRLFSYNLNTRNEISAQLPLKNPLNMDISGNRILLQTNDSLFLFNINLPL